MFSSRIALLALLAFPLLAAAAPPRKAAATAPVQRELRRRTLKLDDASVTTLPDLYVAGGSATVVTFQVPIAEGGAIPGTSKEAFLPIVQTDKTVILLPKDDLTTPVPLNITLTDGTVLTFKCLSHPAIADAQVDVILALEKRAAQESASNLKIRIGQLQGELDECRLNSADAGTQKVASLLLSQDISKPQAFTRNPLHAVTKENRLLAEAHWSYRLLGLMYVVLSVQNRDPDRTWMLDHADVALAGGGTNADVQVKAVATEFPNLAPGGAGRVIVAFTVPSNNAPQKVTITLYEKDGGRRVALSGLDL